MSAQNLENNNHAGLSRRNFLKVAGAAGLAVAGVSLAGCNNSNGGSEGDAASDSGDAGSSEGGEKTVNLAVATSIM